MKMRALGLVAVVLAASCSKANTVTSRSVVPPQPAPVTSGPVASEASPSHVRPSQIEAPPTAASPAAPDRSWKTFRMPSRNIGCIAFGHRLRCDILSGMHPEPSGNCPLDWTGLSIKDTGKPAPMCAGDTAYDPRAPTLSYGQTWGRYGITCRSKTSGLFCSNSSGHGFMLSRELWTIH